MYLSNFAALFMICPQLQNFEIHKGVKMSNNNKIIIDSYSKVFKIEKKIYALQNIRLPVPVKPMEVFFFLLGMGIVLILSTIIPLMDSIPLLNVPVLRYLALPYGFMYFILRKKFDGKNPIKFILDFAIYISNKYKQFERFQPVIMQEKTRVTGYVSIKEEYTPKPKKVKVKKKKQSAESSLQSSPILEAAKARAEAAAVEEKKKRG